MVPVVVFGLSGSALPAPSAGVKFSIRDSGI